MQETELLGYRVEERRIVAVSIWGIHHKPTLWPDPSRFLPERFAASTATETGRRGSGYTHLPFGGGPRACIGEHLAMAELVLAVAALVSSYRLYSLLAEPNVEVDLALRPMSPLPCRLERISPGATTG